MRMPVGGVLEQREVALIAGAETLFDALALGDIADVALNDLLVIGQVHVADKFDVDRSAVAGLERQVVVLDVFLALQFLERDLALLDVLKRSELPEFFPRMSFLE